MPELQVAIDARLARKGALEFIKAAKEMQRVSKQTADAVAKLDGKLARQKKTSSGLARTIKNLVGIYAAFRAVTAATRILAQFDETMRRLQGVAGATRREMELFTETARVLGATTRFSANEAAEGLLFLSRAGFTVNEAVVALPATLQLATAAVIGLGEAADIASNVNVKPCNRFLIASITKSFTAAAIPSIKTPVSLSSRFCADAGPGR